MRFLRPVAAIAALTLLAGATDPNNPTCPAEPDWGPAKAMALTPRVVDGAHVLVAEGIIDSTLPQRLKEAIDKDDQLAEIWMRSRGGDARAGNEAGKIIRSFPGMVTRIPAGWTCFSACNFLFMGGDRRFVDDGGFFMVHMFTHTGDREAIYLAAEEGTAETVRLIADIEQQSALLASEDNDFLIRMGVSRKLLTDIMYRQQAVKTADNPSTRYCLSQEEVRRYNVVPEERAG
ncbi:hypothetical protein KK137_03475 [Croceibacterium sp. LX-88]|jgi:hypothetical protein|uniref:Peptidase S14 n=1 Tax=Croceibacterium selenioxidans TaxID=2838833 RepID=A0ABS5W219_9SPHN|nr:hypothetical protein [Croceibacterium selenioxidans]MBT2133387.1 hypothetical protein [Croceibacterium selenioxidans]